MSPALVLERRRQFRHRTPQNIFLSYQSKGASGTVSMQFSGYYAGSVWFIDILAVQLCQAKQNRADKE